MSHKNWVGSLLTWLLGVLLGWYAGGSESVQENVVHWWRKVEIYRIWMVGSWDAGRCKVGLKEKELKLIKEAYKPSPPQFSAPGAGR